MSRAVEAAGIALWAWNVDTDALEMDERGHALWDVSPHRHLTFEHLSEKIHPADRDRVRSAFVAARAVTGPYEIDFRTLVGEDVRWISARGRASDADMGQRTMTGVFQDVTGRKQAEETALLAGEMSHRVKNLLSVVSGLARITSRSSSDVEDMTDQLTRRLTALARAHDLVRPFPGNHGTAAALGDMLKVLLAPYDDNGAHLGRIRIDVPRIDVGQNAAASLAMIVHELATNALKYGSLSVDEGVLDVSGHMSGDRVRITWTEQGGPEVKAPKPGGYGSGLVRQTLEGPLGGSILFDWRKSGAVIVFEVNAELLAR